MSEFSRRRFAPVLATMLGLVALGSAVVSVQLAVQFQQTGPGGPAADWLITMAVTVPGTAMGVLLAARRPRNPIGWLLLAVLVLAADPAGQYALLDYRVHHGSLPLGWVAAVLMGSSFLVPVLIAILLWLFPDGSLPPGRWRPVAMALIVTGMLVGIAVSVAPGVTAAVRHDISIDPGGQLHPIIGGWTIVGNVTMTAAVGSLLVWLAVQVPRYRRSGTDRREQLKWLYSGAAVVILVLVGALVGPLAAGDAFGLDGPVVNDFIELGGSALAVCMGVAVLKYRLYAIDRIISRVISYVIITAVLGGVFAGLVLFTTRVFPFRATGAVAASTLAAAALFNPLRRRVQRAVDRKFNRARYDAEVVIATFTERLRATVDLNAVRDDLRAAVERACEPAHLSILLPPAPISVVESAWSDR